MFWIFLDEYPILILKNSTQKEEKCMLGILITISIILLLRFAAKSYDDIEFGYEHTTIMHILHGIVQFIVVSAFLVLFIYLFRVSFFAVFL